MKKVLITGASGFIGRALCREFESVYHILGLYHRNRPSGHCETYMKKCDFRDYDSVSRICMEYRPDVVIHCAGIAHQKVGSVTREQYFEVNSNATEYLARAASMSNPQVQFIFLSTISVYGENNLKFPVSEDHGCNPTSDYGISKLEAEKCLIRLWQDGRLQNTAILRLAPVYDREWSLNLDRRVMAPLRMAYIKFGSGMQKMSALAKPNLVDYIRLLIDREIHTLNTIMISNICDRNPYAFHEIIRMFKDSKRYPGRPVIKIPLQLVHFITRLAGFFYPPRRKWFYACYEKLAFSLVFDNTRMLETGFNPLFTLNDIYN